MTTRVDLVAVLVIVALGAPVALLAPDLPAVRVALGLPLLLFLPGYAVLAALYPYRRDIEPAGRLALSFLLSLAVVALVALVLNSLPGGVDRASIVLAISAIIVAFTALAWLLRDQVAVDGEPFQPRLSLRQLWPSRDFGHLPLFGLAVALIGLAAAAFVFFPNTSGRDGFTEFYLLGIDGRLESLPAELAAGDRLRFIVGAANHEGASTRYRIDVKVGGRADRLTVAEFTLGDSEEAEREVDLSLQTAGDDRTVKVLLYRDGDDQPYRQLHLVLDVGRPRMTAP